MTQQDFWSPAPLGSRASVAPKDKDGQVWVLGASGMLGSATVLALQARGYAVVASSSDVDISDLQAVAAFADSYPCATWINCAAMTAVDACEDGGEGAAKNEAVNARGPAVLAAAARKRGARVMHVSTDYVFAGNSHVPYSEEDACAPRSAYGRAKWAGEQGFWRALGPAASCGYVVRTAWLFGPYGNNFVTTMLQLMSRRTQLQVVADQVGRPTFTLDLVQAMLDLLGLHGQAAAGADVQAAAAGGTYHFANGGQTSWHGFAEAILAEAQRRKLGLVCTSVASIPSTAFVRPAPRPAYSVFATQKVAQALGRQPRAFAEALQAYFDLIEPSKEHTKTCDGL